MGPEDIKKLIGKRVVITQRKPDDIEGIVTEIHPCIGEIGYSGITVGENDKATKISFGAMESITVLSSIDK